MLEPELGGPEREVADIVSTADADSLSPRPSHVQFGEVARQYIAIKESTWGTHAAKSSISIIHKHLVGKFGARSVDELTAVEIQLFIGELVKQNASLSLLRKTVEHLRSILDLAHELEVIRCNPMRRSTFKLKYKSQKPRSNRYLTVAECQALIAMLSGRDRLIVRMFIQLGLRPEELFALRRNDVVGEFLRIDEVLSRGALRARKRARLTDTVFVPQGLLLELRKWTAGTHGGDEDWLFPTHRRKCAPLFPISDMTFRNRVLKSAAIEAGLADLDLTTLRRTCAVLFTQHACAPDVQAQMRLSGVKANWKTRLQYFTKSLKASAMEVEARLFPASETHIQTGQSAPRSSARSRPRLRKAPAGWRPFARRRASSILKGGQFAVSSSID